MTGLCVQMLALVGLYVLFFLIWQLPTVHTAVFCLSTTNWPECSTTVCSSLAWHTFACFVHQALHHA